MSHVVVIEDTSTVEMIGLPYDLVLLPATHEVQRRSDMHLRVCEVCRRCLDPISHRYCPSLVVRIT